MTANPHITVAFGLLFGFSFQATGRTIAEQSKFLDNCAKLGTRTVSENPLVMDYGRYSGGKSEEVVCVYDVRCQAPKYNVDERSAVFCKYDSITGCEDFDVCVREMPHRQINTRLAAGPKPAASDRCSGGPDYQYVLPTPAEEETPASPVCVHIAACTGESNTRQPALKPPGVVFCPSTGKTQSMTVAGKEYQAPVCPSVVQCVDNPLPAETPASHQKRLADAREQRERSTSARNSAAEPVAANGTRHKAESNSGSANVSKSQRRPSTP